MENNYPIPDDIKCKAIDLAEDFNGYDKTMFNLTPVE
jgi:hypothetical protein